MAKTQNTDTTKSWEGCGTTETLSYIAGGKSKGTAVTLYISLVVSYKTQHTLII